jgi:hypothetical protein
MHFACILVKSETKSTQGLSPKRQRLSKYILWGPKNGQSQNCPFKLVPIFSSEVGGGVEEGHSRFTCSDRPTALISLRFMASPLSFLFLVFPDITTIVEFYNGPWLKETISFFTSATYYLLYLHCHIGDLKLLVKVAHTNIVPFHQTVSLNKRHT